jgi:hypothetical protein
MANINRQRREFEAKLQEMQIRMALQEQKFNFDAFQKDRMYSLAQSRLEDREQEINSLVRHRQHQDDMRDAEESDYQSFESAVGGMTSKPGDPGFESEFHKIKADHFRGASSKAGIASSRSIESVHNKAINSAKSSLRSDQSAFKQELEMSGVKGEDGKATYDPFLNPQRWQDAYNVRPDGSYEYTGEKMYPTYQTADPSDPTKTKTIQHWVTARPEKVEEWNRKYKSLEERSNAIPDQITDRDTGVYPTTPSHVLPIPTNKSDLRKDQVYDTNMGEKRWTGTGFVDP